MPPVVAIIVVAAIATAQTIYAITSRNWRLLFTGGFEFLAGLLSPKPKAPRPQGRDITVRQPDAFWQIVYGEMRVGGVLGFLHLAGSKNEFLYAVVLLCYGGPDGIESIDKIFFGNEEATFDGAGAATGKYAGYATLEKNLGTDGQAASPLLLADLPGVWLSTDKFSGHAYIVLKLKHNPDLFSDFTTESIRVQLKGRKELDPRTGSTAYSNNPVLLGRGFLVNTRFGLGATTTDFEDAGNNAAANICDELVNLKAGGTEKRYTLNGAFLTDADPGRVLDEMRRTMAGAVTNSAGSWLMRAAAWRPPMVVLDDDDMVGPPRIQMALGRQTLVSGVKGTFVETTHWQPTSYPAQAPADYLTDDGNVRLWGTLDFAFVTSAAQAQRLARIELERTRRQKRIMVACKLLAWQLLPGDTFQFTHARFNKDANDRAWTEKTFFVERVEFVMQQDEQGGTVPVVNIHAREENAGVYYWNPAAMETTFTAPPSGTFPDSSNAGQAAGAANLAVWGGFTYRPTSNPLTATDAGASATVSVAAFTMRV